MSESMYSLLNEHGTLFLFVHVLLVQSGLPIPAVPFLVVAGGLAAAGQLDPLLVIAAAVSASVLADYGWYLAGRRIGPRLLARVCSLSLSPGACARRVQAGYGRWGGALLLFAKFIPGVALIAPPMAGVLRMPRHVFLFYSGLGGLLWSGTFVALGFALDVQARRVFALLDSVGHYTILVIATALWACLLYRLVQRRRLLAVLRP